MERVAKGQTAKHIARELGISHRTVENHIASAIEALGAKNRLGAVARFLDLEKEDEVPVERPAFMLQAPLSAEEAHIVENEQTEKECAQQADQPWPLFPPLGGSANKAPREVRMEWMIRIAILAIMFTCAVILSILGLLEIAR